MILRPRRIISPVLISCWMYRTSQPTKMKEAVRNPPQRQHAFGCHPRYKKFPDEDSRIPLRGLK